MYMHVHTCVHVHVSKSMVILQMYNLIPKYGTRTVHYTITQCTVDEYILMLGVANETEQLRLVMSI